MTTLLIVYAVTFIFLEGIIMYGVDRRELDSELGVLALFWPLGIIFAIGYAGYRLAQRVTGETDER